MTLATSADSQPWCCHVFYAYDAANNILLFTSGDHTRHISEALTNPQVGVSIVLESKVVARLQGVQITGVVSRAEDDSLFVKRFPFIKLAPKTIWQVEITTAKFTDNTLGFGTKLNYEKLT